MKKFYAVLMTCCMCLTAVGAMAANVQVKKASSVKKQETSGLESITAGSLLPGVIGLVSNVSALSKQQKELAAECVPSGSEITWLNNIIKEYAKIGVKTPEDMRGSGKQECANDSAYSSDVETLKTSSPDSICVPVFKDDTGDIWNGYPKAMTAEYCGDGSGSLSLCSGSKKKTETNFYTLFSQIDFSPEDYTVDEADMYAKLVEKAEKCAPEKMSARTKQAAAEFLKTTISGVGTTTNTGGVWDAVSGLSQGGGGLSGVQSLMPAVTQFLDK